MGLYPSTVDIIFHKNYLFGGREYVNVRKRFSLELYYIRSVIQTKFIEYCEGFVPNKNVLIHLPEFIFSLLLLMQILIKKKKIRINAPDTLWLYRGLCSYHNSGEKALVTRSP